MEWDELNRKPFLPNLLESIALEAVSYEFLKTEVLPDIMIQESHASCIQVMKALTHCVDKIFREKEEIVNSNPLYSPIERFNNYDPNSFNQRRRRFP